MPFRALGLIVLLSGQALHAQAPAAPPAAVVPSQPPRDAAPPATTGTASIRGRVLAADSNRPLRRAHVVLTAPELGRQNRDVTTDIDGRYEVTNLPAASYTVTVTRSGYLRLRYGQTRPLEQGKPLNIGAGQRVDNVDFALAKMGVIAGRITDELGEPIEGASVFAMDFEYFNGRRRLAVASQTVRTDDIGQYRITGLMPGTYLVLATLRETWTVMQTGKPE